MWYWTFRALFKGILRLFFRFKVEGLDNLPLKTNFIVVANHTSFMDAPAVGSAIPMKIYWLIAHELRHISWLRWFLIKTETFTVGRSSGEVIDLVTQNKNVGLFPEAICSPDGKLGEFRRGAALLALKTGRPIVPCAVLGAYEALPVDKKLPKPGPVKVKIGKPVYLMKEFIDVIDDVYLQEGMMRAKNSIQEMLDAG